MLKRPIYNQHFGNFLGENRASSGENEASRRSILVGEIKAQCTKVFRQTPVS